MIEVSPWTLVVLIQAILFLLSGVVFLSFRGKQRQQHLKEEVEELNERLAETAEVVAERPVPRPPSLNEIQESFSSTSDFGEGEEEPKVVLLDADDMQCVSEGIPPNDSFEKLKSYESAVQDAVMILDQDEPDTEAALTRLKEPDAAGEWTPPELDHNRLNELILARADSQSTEELDQLRSEMLRSIREEHKASDALNELSSSVHEKSEALEELEKRLQEAHTENSKLKGEMQTLSEEYQRLFEKSQQREETKASTPDIPDTPKPETAEPEPDTPEEPKASESSDQEPMFIDEAPSADLQPQA